MNINLNQVNICDSFDWYPICKQKFRINIRITTFICEKNGLLET